MSSNFRETEMLSLGASLPVASSVAAVVGEAYIVGAPANCQQRFRSFFNFYNTTTQPRAGRCVSKAVAPADLATDPPFTGRGPGIAPPERRRQPSSREKDWIFPRKKLPGARTLLRWAIMGGW